jgi:hypothetical protein
MHFYKESMDIFTMSKKKQNKRLVRVLLGVGVASLITIALKEQLALPPEQRTWQGKVLGMPYDFRIPSREILQEAFWNSETSQVLVPRPFVIGWTVNLYPIVHPKTA